MDCPQSENRNSEDTVRLELSPPNSKGNSETERSANDSSENPNLVEKPEEPGKEEDVSSERKIELANVASLDGASPEEKSDKEAPKQSLPTKGDEIKKKRESSLPETSNSSKLSTGSSKIGNVGKVVATTANDAKETKRKRTIASDQRGELSNDESEAKAKRAKTKSTNDNFCWRCHKESVDAKCSACPRSWHRKCMGGAPPTSINETWICGECATILRAENAETRSEVMAHLSIDHLCMLLKYIVERMRSCQGSEPFWKAVDLNEVPNYMDYVVRPMDLDLLESNVRSKLYGSTDAFMADAKWIQHNCIVFNTCGGVYADTSKLTNAAKQIIKTAKQEVAEIEACPDCYVRGRNLPRPHPSWFVEACRKPHPLIWAKLKGFPFWPAKAMPRVNGQGHVDVRFFGQHDRAWVAPKDLYLYSREPPSPLPRKRKLEMAECIKEITRHCRKLEVPFGPFQFAPSKTPYNPQDPMQIKIMLPQYDPSRPNDLASSSALSARRKSPFRKRSAAAAVATKRRFEADASANDSATDDTGNPATSPNSQVRGAEKPAGTNAEEASAESARLKKRQSKVSVSRDDETAASVPEATSAAAAAASSDSPPTSVKTSAISNGTPEAKSNVTESRAVVSESKVGTGTAAGPGLTAKPKTEKAAIPLEKSLAGLLRNVSATKGRLSHSRNSGSKSAAVSVHGGANPKPEARASIKVYKPKARMVDKVNAERALNSTVKDRKEEETTDLSKTPEGKLVNGLLTPVASPGVALASPAGIPGAAISLLQSKRDSNIVISSSLLKTTPKKLQTTRILLVNNGSLEPKQILGTTNEDAKPRSEPVTPVRVKQEPNVSPQAAAAAVAAQQKQSRAKKTFPNKPPRLPHLLPKLPKVAKPPPTPAAAAKSLDTMVYIPTHGSENGMDYQLPPPEAGPLSAQLHRGANELAKRMGQFLEEAVRQAAESNSGGGGGAGGGGGGGGGGSELGDTLDGHQATIHSLRLQIERMRWQHQQQLAELKHNTDRTLREMRASLEAERLRAIEEVRREAEEERTRCVDETKTKQWCAHCGREALFYCCWNTAYCDHLCQQAHWQAHQRKCAQKPSLGSLGSSSVTDSSNQQEQQKQQQQQQRQAIRKVAKLQWERCLRNGTEIESNGVSELDRLDLLSDRERSMGNPLVGKIEVSKLRSPCLSSTVPTKNLKIP